MNFQVTLTIDGPELTTETNYGPRVSRDTLARIAVPVEPDRAWSLLAYVVYAVNQGTGVLDLTDDEREKVIAEATRPVR